MLRDCDLGVNRTGGSDWVFEIYIFGICEGGFWNGTCSGGIEGDWKWFGCIYIGE